MSNKPATETTLDYLRKSMKHDIMDFTGKVATAKYVLNDDTFDGGDPCGWRALATPDPTTDNDARGVVQPYPSGCFSGWAMRAYTSEALGLSAFGSAMMIKRGAQWAGYGRYLLEFWVSLNYGFQGQVRVNGITLGYDTADASGARRLFALRYYNYDEGTATRVANWQLDRNGVFTTFLANHPMQSNENKDLPYYVAMEINTLTGEVLGVRINNFCKQGSLAGAPDAGFSKVGPPGLPLPTFEDGANPLVEIRNRTDTSASDSEAVLHRQRTCFLGA